MPRNLRIAALAILILLACSVARSHSDGIYNPAANNVGNFEGIDSNKASGGGTLACTYTPVTSGTQNVAYTGATPSASGGVPAYTFSETGSLPTGLSINTSTGVISGTPSVNGSFPSIQVKVTDTASTVVNCGAAFTLVISAPLPVVSFVSSTFATSGTGTTTLTITGANIGNPAYIATRRVILAFSGLQNSAVPVSGTINGVALNQFTTLSNGASGAEGVDFASAPVSSGTTGVTISVTFAFAVNNPLIAIYNVDGSLLSSITPTTGYTSNISGTGLNTTTVNTTTKAGGFILAAVWAGGGAGPSITASTETYTTDFSSSANFSAHANGISSNASNSVSTQAPPAGGNSGLGLAAWR